MSKSFKITNDGDEAVTIRLADPANNAVLADTPIAPGEDHVFHVSDGVVLSEAPGESGED